MPNAPTPDRADAVAPGEDPRPGRRRPVPPGGDPGAPGSAATAREAGIAANEGHNTLLLVAQAVVLRVGWIFKTESVIIPAFLDSIAGAGWLRGVLPIANRVGQSIVPFLLARRISGLARKKWVFLGAVVGMAAVFLLLAAALFAWGGGPQAGYPLAFILLYTVFFAFTGLSGQAGGTLTGKLIPAHRRGRFLMWSTAGGVVPAVAIVFWLLPGWLEQGDAGYAKIFTFTGVCFLASAAVLAWLREPPDAPDDRPAPTENVFASGLGVLRRDHNFRRLVIVNGLFTMTIILLPHYQSLARERLGLAGGSMMEWVALQNLAVGGISLVIGPLADRYGNRLSLRIVVLISACIPLLAIGLTWLEPDVGRRLFNLVFVGIGVTPIALRLVANYILEIAPPDEHPRYLALAPLCATIVMLTSPLFGGAIDWIGYEAVFGTVAALVLAGGLLTFRLEEPRFAQAAAPPEGPAPRDGR